MQSLLLVVFVFLCVVPLIKAWSYVKDQSDWHGSIGFWKKQVADLLIIINSKSFFIHFSKLRQDSVFFFDTKYLIISYFDLWSEINFITADNWLIKHRNFLLSSQKKKKKYSYPTCLKHVIFTNSSFVDKKPDLKHFSLFLGFSSNFSFCFCIFCPSRMQFSVMREGEREKIHLSVCDSVFIMQRNQIELIRMCISGIIILS